MAVEWRSLLIIKATVLAAVFLFNLSCCSTYNLSLTMNATSSGCITANAQNFMCTVPPKLPACSVIG